jgi:hypothetical protein
MVQLFAQFPPSKPNGAGIAGWQNRLKLQRLLHFRNIVWSGFLAAPKALRNLICDKWAALSMRPFQKRLEK